MGCLRGAHHQLVQFSPEVRQFLWMLQQAFHGPVKKEFNKVKDADNLEKVYMFVLVAVIMLVGIYPAILTDVFKVGIAPIVKLIGG